MDTFLNAAELLVENFFSVFNSINDFFHPRVIVRSDHVGSYMYREFSRTTALLYEYKKDYATDSYYLRISHDQEKQIARICVELKKMIEWFVDSRVVVPVYEAISQIKGLREKLVVEDYSRGFDGFEEDYYLCKMSVYNQILAQCSSLKYKIICWRADVEEEDEARCGGQPVRRRISFIRNLACPHSTQAICFASFALCFICSWYISARVWNALMHALNGNTTPHKEQFHSGIQFPLKDYGLTKDSDAPTRRKVMLRLAAMTYRYYEEKKKLPGNMAPTYAYCVKYHRKYYREYSPLTQLPPCKIFLAEPDMPVKAGLKEVEEKVPSRVEEKEEKIIKHVTYSNYTSRPLKHPNAFSPESDCTFCAFSGKNKICEPCYTLLKKIESHPLYDTRLGLKRTQLVKIFKKEGFQGVHKHMERVMKKNPIYHKPRVPCQPTRDFCLKSIDDPEFDGEVLAWFSRFDKEQMTPRDALRLQKFIIEKSRDAAEEVEKVEKQGGDFMKTIGDLFTNVVRFCCDSGITKVVILAIAASLLSAVTVWLLRRKSDSLILQLLQGAAFIISGVLAIFALSEIPPAMIVAIGRVKNAYEEYRKKMNSVEEKVEVQGKEKEKDDLPDLYDSDSDDETVDTNPEEDPTWFTSARENGDKWTYIHPRMGETDNLVYWPKEMILAQREFFISSKITILGKVYPSLTAWRKELKSTPPDIRKQGDDEWSKMFDKVVDSLSSALKTTVEATAEGLGASKQNLPHMNSYLHSFATSLRDAKTVYEIFAPLVESIIGAIYTGVTGQIYYSTKDELYLATLKPLFERINSLSSNPEFLRDIGGDIDFRRRVEECCVEYRSLQASFMKTVPNRMNSLFLSHLATILQWEQKLREVKVTGFERVKPQWFYFFGAPRQGKTELRECLIRDIHNNLHKYDGVKRPEYRPEMNFEYRRDNVYMDGYREQEYMSINEIFQSSDTKIRSLEAVELIKIVDTAPMQCHMAAVQDKAGVFLRIKFLITTTNDTCTPGLGPDSKEIELADKTALWRRRDITAKIVLARPDPTAARLTNEYKKGWDIYLYDIFGVELAKIDYFQLLDMCCLMVHQENLRFNQKGESFDLVPTESASQMVKAIHASNMSSTLTAVSGKTLTVARKAPKVSTSPTQVTSPETIALLKQGSGRSKNDILEQTLEELGCPPEPSSMEKFISWMESTNEILYEFSDSTKKELVSVYRKCSVSQRYATIQSRMKELWHSLELKWAAIKDWTVDKFNHVQQLCSRFYLYCTGSVWEIIYQNVIQSAKSIFQKISSHVTLRGFLKLGAVVIGLGAVFAAAFAIYNYLSPEEPQPPKPQSTSVGEQRESRGSWQTISQFSNPSRSSRSTKSQHSNQSMRSRYSNYSGYTEKSDYSKQVGTRDYSFLQVLLKNSYYFETIDCNEQNHGAGNLLFLCGRVAVTARHIADKMRENVPRAGRYVMKRGRSDIGEAFKEQRLVEELVFRNIPNTEMAAVVFPPAIPMHADIRNHIPPYAMILDHEDNFMEQCYLSHVDALGCVNHKLIGLAEVEELKPYDDVETALYWSSRYTSEFTVGGESGSFWWTTNPKMPYKLLGIHSGGQGAHAISSILTRELADSIVGSAQPKSVPLDVDQTGEIPDPIGQNIISTSIVKQGAHLPRKNPISMSPIARNLYDMENPKSGEWITSTLPTVVKKIVPFIEERNWRGKGVKFKAHTENNTEVSPLELALKKLEFEKPLISSSHFKAIENWWTTLPVQRAGPYRIHSHETIIYGNSSLNVDGIRMDASPGYPFVVMPGFVTRKQIFFKNEKPIVPEHFLNRLKKIVEENKGLGQYLPVYTLSLKIERKPCEKVLVDTKTRAFMAGPVDQQIIGQMIFYDLMENVMKDPTGEWTIGVNPHSRDWTTLYGRLNKWPDKICFDAANWDLSQEIEGIDFVAGSVSQAIASNRLKMMTNLFQQDDVKKLAYKAVLGCSQSYVVLMNQLYEIWWGVRSGNFITSLLNCFLNSIRWRITYAVLAIETRNLKKSPLEDFKRNVEAAFHGDDAIVTPRPSIREWFNQQSTSSTMKRVFNITWTDNYKRTSSDLPLFCPNEDVTFLGRGFRTVKHHVFAPLKLEIIRDMVLWVTDTSRAVQICSETVRSAVYELCHHPDEVALPIIEDLQKACVQAKIPWLALSRDQLIHRIRDGEGLTNPLLRSGCMAWDYDQ